MIVHPIAPLYDENSKILILGSFPSVKSRETGFYYGHPQNRFWRVISTVLSENMPRSIEDKRKMLLSRNIALWDVIASCEIEGSADSTIRNVTPNDITTILKNSKVDRIFVNGKTAEKLYIKYLEKSVGIKAVCLPSTSPANAGWSLEKLIKSWKDFLNI